MNRDDFQSSCEYTSPNHLPEGWCWAELNEIVINPTSDIVDGPFGSDLKSSEYTDKGIPIIRIQNVDRNKFIKKNIQFISAKKAQELKRHNFRPGDIVVTKLGDPLGKACIVPKNFGPGIVVADIVRLRLNHEFCSVPYLVHSINSESAAKQLSFNIKGTTRPRVNLGHIRSLRIPFAPFSEQKRIVEKLGEMFTRVNVTKERVAKVSMILKRFRQAVLAAACSGRLTADWRDQKGIQLEGWKEAVLKDVAQLRLGKMLDKAKNIGKPIHYLRNLNVRWFSFDLSSTVKMRATPQEQKELEIRNGDLLVCEGGEPGRCAVWNLGETDLIFQKAVHRIRVRDDVTPYWVALNIKNDANSGHLEDYFTGTTIKHLTGKALATYRFQLPPLSEQHEIVRRVESMFKLDDTVEKRVSLATSRAEKISQAILAKAFRGELVPTEAELARREGRSYESASDLLSRIKAEREATKAPTSSPRGRAHKRQV
jgi:type I restriction enzyme S subunit